MIPACFSLQNERRIRILENNQPGSYFLTLKPWLSLITRNARLQWRYPLTISSEIALQVVKTSF